MNFIAEMQRQCDELESTLAQCDPASLAQSALFHQTRSRVLSHQVRVAAWLAELSEHTPVHGFRADAAHTAQ